MKNQRMPYQLPPACRRGVRMYAAGTAARTIADRVVDRAFRGNGVRVFGLPSGVVALVAVGVGSDSKLCETFGECLLATYSGRGVAPVCRHEQVVEEIEWWRASEVLA